MRKCMIPLLFCVGMMWHTSLYASETVPDLFAETSESEEQKDQTSQETIWLGHGFKELMEDPSQIYPLFYDKNPLEFDYTVEGKGAKDRDIGLMMFLDGIPQPYWTDSSEELSYMHTIQGQQLFTTEMKMKLIPIVGMKNDDLDICVASILYPSFCPDMKNTKLYGYYHSFLDCINELEFKSDVIEKQQLPEIQNRLFNVSSSQEELTSEKKKLYLMQTQYTEAELKNTVLTKLYINGEDTQLKNNLAIDQEEVLHLRMELMGYPLAEYRVSVFLNHEPVGCDGEVVAEVLPTIRDGQISVFEADLDVSDLSEIETLYLVAAPRNAMKHNREFGLQKTNSIALYREADGENTKQ